MDRLLSLIETRSGTLLKDARLARVKTFIQAQADQGISPNRLEMSLSQSDFSHPAWQALIQQISVGETYFFRNQAHFDALRNDVLPTLIQQRRRQRQHYLRLWVAGCATGEEAYSLAMMICDLLPDLTDWSIFILATDINLSFLEFARRGLYRRRAFRKETPPDIQARFFTETDEGYQITSHIRQMVTFAPLNLIDPVYPSLANNSTSFDLISCRNVTIYFDQPTTQQIINRFHDALRPEGWLLVGHAEPQPSVYDAFTHHNLKRAILYQKPHAPRHAPPPPTPPSPRPAPPVASPPPPPVPTLEGPFLDDLLLVARQAANDEQWDPALDALAEAELLDRFHPEIHYLRGLVYTHLDETHAAIQSFRQAVYCEPSFALAHYALAELFLSLGQARPAIASWRRASKLLAGQAPDVIVRGAEDLTIGMLQELVDHRLQQEEA